MIGFTKDESEPDWRGYVYAVILFLTAVVQSLFLHQYFHRCFTIGMRMRTAIIAAVYNKVVILREGERERERWREGGRKYFQYIKLIGFTIIWKTVSKAHVLFVLKYVGSSSEQQGSSYQHSGRDSQPDVSGRSATYGSDVLHPHHLVSSSSDRPLPGLPLHDHGAVHLCWICCHDTDDSCKRCHRYLEQKTAGEADDTQRLENQAR